MKYTLLKNRVTGARRIRNNETGEYTVENDNYKAYAQLRVRVLNLAKAAAKNQVLRELTGTSARAAREDMGL
jgi:hypothetical protein